MSFEVELLRMYQCLLKVWTETSCREQPFFSNEQEAKIGNGLEVQFLVTAVQWIDEGRNLKKKYLVFGRVEGESLGPVSLSSGDGTDDINL
ncbi:hypothetical protein WN943_028948 [Citrus x changshan-huyou]